MQCYTVQLTSPHIDYVVTANITAKSYGTAVSAIRKQYQWAEPITIRGIWLNENPDEKNVYISLSQNLRTTLIYYLLISTKYREGSVTLGSVCPLRRMRMARRVLLTQKTI